MVMFELEKLSIKRTTDFGNYEIANIHSQYSKKSRRYIILNKIMRLKTYLIGFYKDRLIQP